MFVEEEAPCINVSSVIHKHTEIYYQHNGVGWGGREVKMRMWRQGWWFQSLLVRRLRSSRASVLFGGKSKALCAFLFCDLHCAPMERYVHSRLRYRAIF